MTLHGFPKMQIVGRTGSPINSLIGNIRTLYLLLEKSHDSTAIWRGWRMILWRRLAEVDFIRNLIRGRAEAFRRSSSSSDWLSGLDTEICWWMNFDRGHC